MRLTRLRVTNYRGIAALETKIPAGGLMVSGENGGGKTSVLRAIRAALSAQDISADAIRIGEDRAEILVDLEDVSVKRVITSKGSKLSVEAGDAKPIKAPQTWLNDLLGTAPLDPIDLVHAKPKDRKAQILAALPIRVTAEQVAEWTKGWILETRPDLELHGLEVVEQLRKEFYRRRGEANAQAKEIGKGIDALVAGAPPAVAGAHPLHVTEELDRRAKAARADLDARARRVAEQGAKTQATRDRAAALRRQADEIDARPRLNPSAIADAQTRLDAAAEVVRLANEAIADLETRLSSARQRAQAAAGAREEARQALETEQRAAAAEADLALKVGTFRDQADALEAAIAATAEAAPTEEEIATADRVIVGATEEWEKAVAAQRRTEHEAKIEVERARLTAADEEAGKLNGMVDRFAKEVPNQLLQAANGVPGLAIDGDDVLLDGVKIDALSGREQLLFAVEIARRLNVRAKILVVDGLERVDPDALPEFIAKATAGGFQLIATRVDKGEVVLEAIEPDAGASA